ncbi:MAG TPA: DUF1887 family CARF protein [Blastocatellia bacterium]|nr:DUF1887 family CARF protein [Blastocatellia bacterium]
MPSEKLETSKVEHLLLLVGENPLPNAIAGNLLVAPTGKITLLHSTETVQAAQKLQGWFSKRGMNIELKKIEESNPVSITQGVFERLDKRNASSVGLNYTGGTKAMAVHAYRALEKWAKAKNLSPIFSYLDARTLSLVIDPGDGESHDVQIEYVGRHVIMELRELMKLHGWLLSHPPVTTPVLPQSAKTLADVYADIALADQYKDWKHNHLNPKCRINPYAWNKNENTLRTVRLDFSSAPSAFTASLLDELNQPNQSILIGDVMRVCGFTKAENVCEWLDGKWLEHHILDVLNPLKNKLHLHECALNVETKDVQFEVDVIAMRGYQLFAFSCSTDTDSKGGKQILKKKLFEAYIRARQLGGSEARVALVCAANYPERIEAEMKRDVDQEGRIRVFGRPDLANLNFHIEQWVLSQSGE